MNAEAAHRGLAFTFTVLPAGRSPGINNHPHHAPRRRGTLRTTPNRTHQFHRTLKAASSSSRGTLPAKTTAVTSSTPNWSAM